MDFSFIKLPLLLAESPFRESLDRVWHFFETGGWFMLPVVLCSFVAVTLTIMKFYDLRVSAVVPEPLAEKLAHVEELAAAGKLSDVTRSLRENESSLARIARHALLPTHGSREEAEKSTEAVGREELSRLERGIPGLEVIFTIAPLLGLIGTASGMVRIFGSFGERTPGPEQARLISLGISEALNTTIAGLAVAVPCYIFQSYFARRLEGLSLRMGTLTTGLIHAAYRPIEIPPAPPPPVEAPAREAKAPLKITRPAPITKAGEDIATAPENA